MLSHIGGYTYVMSSWNCPTVHVAEEEASAVNVPIYKLAATDWDDIPQIACRSCQCRVFFSPHPPVASALCRGSPQPFVPHTADAIPRACEAPPDGVDVSHTSISSISERRQGYPAAVARRICFMCIP